jgi:hypothetical protein
MNITRNHSCFEPAVRGIISRRVLVNYRVRPEVLAKLIPAPFRPQLVHGWAMAGICLIRMEAVRPAFVSMPWGVSSENAAHRIAVEWDEAGGSRTGVFVLRRDTNSRFNHLVGGRIFPGVHHLAHFDCSDNDGHLSVEMRSDDDTTCVAVAGHAGGQWDCGSLFSGAEEASEFFRCGACGWSPGLVDGRFEGLELCAASWRITPLLVDHVESSFFDDRSFFPSGSIEFDSALVMRNIEHEWRPLGTLGIGASAKAPAPRRHAAFFEFP